MATNYDTQALRKISILTDLPPWQMEVIAEAGGKGKSPNHGRGGTAVRTDIPSGGIIDGFCRIPESS